MVSLSASNREKSLLASDGARKSNFRPVEENSRIFFYEKKITVMRAAQVRGKRVHGMLRKWKIRMGGCKVYLVLLCMQFC